MKLWLQCNSSAEDFILATNTKDNVIVWLAQNRGVLTSISKQVHPAVTPQYVSQVVRGLRKSKDGKIERLLKSHGAPI